MIKNVIEVEFGKSEREVANNLANVISTLKESDVKFREELFKDPVKFYREAILEIQKLRRFINQLQQVPEDSSFEFYRGEICEFQLFNLTKEQHRYFTKWSKLIEGFKL